VLLCRTAASEQRARGLAYQVLRSLHRPYWIEERRIEVRFSAGVALWPAHGSDVEELLKNAGFARNMARGQPTEQQRVRVYEPELRRQVLDRRRTTEELSRALESGELFLEYQPIVDLDTGRVEAVEALVRWQHPAKGTLMPDSFVPVAESSELILRIGEWILEEACRDAKRWDRQGVSGVAVCVNVSAAQFESPGFVRKVRHLLQEADIDPSLLEIELTESTVIQDVTESVRRLQELRDLGVRSSIDDFGTGYSSLSYMVQLPIDTLKIDRSFVAQLEHSDQARVVVSTIIGMANSLKLRLVAEGVENDRQRSIMRSESCRLAQGFYFSTPLKSNSLIELLRQGRVFRPPDVSSV